MKKGVGRLHDNCGNTLALYLAPLNYADFLPALVDFFREKKHMAISKNRSDLPLR
jgi:hypothetical protein